MKPEKLAGYIRKAGKAERILEFQCPYVPEFFVKLAYASKYVMVQIREVAREVFRNPRTRVEEERLNDEKLREEYAKQIVKDWRGLTIGKLDKLVPGTLEEAVKAQKEEKKKDPEFKVLSIEELEKVEVPFAYDAALAIIENSIEFENWIVDIAMTVENYSKIAELKAKEYENLK